MKTMLTKIKILSFSFLIITMLIMINKMNNVKAETIEVEPNNDFQNAQEVTLG